MYREQAFSVPSYHRSNYDDLFVSSVARRGGEDVAPPEHCLVNAAGYRISAFDLSTLLQHAPEDRRTDELGSVTDFIRRIDDEKQEWRGVEIGRGEVRLNTQTTGTMKNTGYLDLVVGEPVFCLPAVASLSAVHPSENFFEFRNKTYVHPITMSEFEHERFRLDVLAIQEQGDKAKTRTILGEIIQRAKKKSSMIDVDKLATYLSAQYPVGTIVSEAAYNNRRSNHQEDRQTVIPIGGVFVVMFNQIK